MNETGNKCAQLKRRLNAGKPVTGELLEFALSLVPEPRPDGDKYGELWAEMTRNLRAGEPLSSYGHHLMVDVFLLHVRLQAAADERTKSET